MKLFYNDFNEYHPDGKRDSIVALANRLGPDGLGVMDGIGMQSHLSTSWPPIGTYKAAVDMFAATGLEIHITELDITIENTSTPPTAAQLAAQAQLYKDVFTVLKEAREGGANITSVSVWGVTDNRSWRRERFPLLFNAQGQKKPAYDEVAALIPERFHGDGDNPQFNVPDPQDPDTDENGFFFYHTFENESTQGWARRGPNETVVNTTANANNGARSIYVSGRTSDWNGAQFALPSAFVAGRTYSFSVMAMYTDGDPTAEIQLSMQLSLDGMDQYPAIATVTATRGEWIQIANPNFVIPAGATGMSIYVQMPGTLFNFYVDDAMGAPAGVTINPDGTPGVVSVLMPNTAARPVTPLVTLRGKTLSVNDSPDSRVRVKVVNMAGKTVANFNARGGADLSLRRLPAGTYIVEARRVRDGMRTTSSIVLR